LFHKKGRLRRQPPLVAYAEVNTGFSGFVSLVATSDVGKDQGSNQNKGIFPAAACQK
jgi:hypothetical protein